MEGCVTDGDEGFGDTDRDWTWHTGRSEDHSWLYRNAGAAITNYLALVSNTFDRAALPVRKLLFEQQWALLESTVHWLPRQQLRIPQHSNDVGTALFDTEQRQEREILFPVRTGKRRKHR